jgi:hypothetical protein
MAIRPDPTFGQVNVARPPPCRFVATCQGAGHASFAGYGGRLAFAAGAFRRVPIENAL